MKRIKYGKEPILHLFNYIVVVIRTPKKRSVVAKRKGNGPWCSRQIAYVDNLKQVKAVRDHAPKGCVVEVYKARHDFREAWAK